MWSEEVERLTPGSRMRIAAEREREGLERQGIAREQLRRCEASAADGTRLTGCVKAYVPIGAGAPSERPFGFVFAFAPQARTLVLIAYGSRHPLGAERSVYERAHKRLHRRYPDE